MTEPPLNSPVKNCRTCAHYVASSCNALDKCALNGMEYCAAVHMMDDIREMSGIARKCHWQAKPPPVPDAPRRGILQMIRDLFWNPSA